MTNSVPATRQSAVNLLKGARTIAKKINDTWQVGPKARMFTRKPDPQKKYFRTDKRSGQRVEYKVVRTNRLVSGHAYKLALSGAALNAAAVFNSDGGAYNTAVEGEKSRSPWLPAMSSGATLMLEQFLCAYAQEATAHARDVRVVLNTVTKEDGTSHCTQKRLTGGTMKLAFDAVDARVFGAAAPSSRVVVCNARAKAKKEKADEGKPGAEGSKPAKASKAGKA